MQPEEIEIDVDQIMQQIRAEILAQKQAAGVEGVRHLQVTGKRFPPEFYDHLYRAGMLYDQLQQRQQVVPSSLPLVGGLIDRLRGMVHAVVLFYVNRMAADQIAINRHLLEAVSLLSQELEKDMEGSDAA